MNPLKRTWKHATVATLMVFATVVTPVLSSLAAEPKEAKGASTALSPEALGAKAILEDLLVRRYSNELATLVSRDAFSLGAQLDLVAVPPPPPMLAAKPTPEWEPLNDMMLGTIDADALMKSYAGPIDDRPQATKILDNFRIKAVSVYVGLRDELDPGVKGEVEGWLKKRVNAEFGRAGKGNVSVIKVPMKKKEMVVEKTPEQWLEKFQSLAGQIVIAIAVLLGVILYAMIARPAGASEAAYGGGSSENESDLAALQRAAAEVEADNKKSGILDEEQDEREKARAANEIDQIKIRMVELVPQLSGYLEEIVRNWCHMGDAGKLRIACFAEVAGKEIGKLPIPVDALADIQKIFQKMPEIKVRDRRDALQRAYWDLLSALNLGSDSLSQPFGYLDGLNVKMVNRVLMNENPKLRTVVSLYMTDDLRAKYVRSLPTDKKKELLETAAGLSEIMQDELEGYNRGLMSRLSPTRGKEIVPLEMSLSKLVAALSPIEECTLLAEMTGSAIEDYKRTVPSLAFLHQWPDDKLKILLMGITPDELISFLRVRSDLKDRFLELASMMVREIATDELSRPDKMTPQEKEDGLRFFSTRLADIVSQGDMSLTEVFGEREEEPALAVVPETEPEDPTKKVA